MVKPKYGISHYGLGLKYEPITHKLVHSRRVALDSTVIPSLLHSFWLSHLRFPLVIDM